MVKTCKDRGFLQFFPPNWPLFFSSIRVARPCYQRSGMLLMTPVIGKRWCRSHGRAGLQGVDGWKSVGTPMCRCLKHFECFRQPTFVSVRNMLGTCSTILTCFQCVFYFVEVSENLRDTRSNQARLEKRRLQAAGWPCMDDLFPLVGLLERGSPNNEWVNADRWYLLLRFITSIVINGIYSY